MRILIYIAIFLSALNASAQEAIYSSASIHHPEMAKNGMVSTQHELASKVGIKVLEQGGNAVDAAVAVGFALAVVLPRAGNIGGGGFMMIHHEQRDTTVAIDYREMAPSKASRDMYLNQDGQVDKELFDQSYLSIGVPGTVAGLIEALNNFGTMPLSDLIQPAIELAERGFPISQDLSDLLIKYEERLKKCPASKKIFYPESGYFHKGDTLKQSDLAHSLKIISEEGAASFYSGILGKTIVEGILKNGGILNLKDFKNYHTKTKNPIWGNYRGYKIASMPPPSSGGVHLIQMLNILEQYNLQEYGHNAAAVIHYMVEAMRYAYADRSKHLGDPDFWEVPVQGIISKKYAQAIAQKINPHLATKSKAVLPGTPQAYESNETTHYSIADRYGNVVSNTYTLNFSFGTGLMIDGTGILLNNEMGDFSAKPGIPNAYGLVGGEANKIEGHKRPLSSMTPTIVFNEDKPYLVTGTPGGSRIITTVLQLIVGVIDFNLNVAEATHAHRIHHQWYPDILYYESGLNEDTKAILKSYGHQLQQRNAMGSTQSIMIDKDLFYGCSDPRRPDAKTLGF